MPMSYSRLLAESRVRPVCRWTSRLRSDEYIEDASIMEAWFAAGLICTIRRSRLAYLPDADTARDLDCTIRGSRIVRARASRFR
jgi:hypothetical protein